MVLEYRDIRIDTVAFDENTTKILAIPRVNAIRWIDLAFFVESVEGNTADPTEIQDTILNIIKKIRLVVDGDENKNSLVDEDFSVDNADFANIPAIEIGSPITFETLTSVNFTQGPAGSDTAAAQESGIFQTVLDEDAGEAIRTNGGDSLTVGTFAQRANIGIATTSASINVNNTALVRTPSLAHTESTISDSNIHGYSHNAVSSYTQEKLQQTPAPPPHKPPPPRRQPQPSRRLAGERHLHPEQQGPHALRITTQGELASWEWRDRRRPQVGERRTRQTSQSPLASLRAYPCSYLA